MKVFSRKYEVYVLFILFIIILLIYCIFSTKFCFTDICEYVNLSKDFAGFNKTNIYLIHSVSYGLFLSLFLRIFPYLLTLKIISSLFLILDAYLLYKLTNNKKVLWLWIFSPLVYYMSIVISPILASSSCLLLSYYFLKRYENENKKVYFVISALSLGLVGIFRTSGFVIIALFMLIFFYNKKFKEFFYYLILVLIVLSFQLLIDYILFGIPFYSILTLASGQTPLYSLPKFLSWQWLISLIIISPFTLLIYKTKNKKELLFIIIGYLYFSVLAHPRLLLIIAPFVIILLSKILNKRLILINSLISIIIISLLTYNYFGNNEDNILKNDLISLEKDFENRIIVTSNGDAYFFPALYWNDFHYIWLRDYTLHKQNKTTYNRYTIKSYPIIRNSKIMEININLNQNKDPILETVNEKDLLFIFKKEEIEYDEKTKTLVVKWFKERIKIYNLNLIKCYQIICVFEK